MAETISNYAEGGTVDNAVQYGKKLDKNQDRLLEEGKISPLAYALKKSGAQIMNGFISISGLNDMEKSSEKLGYDYGQKAPKEELVEKRNKTFKKFVEPFENAANNQFEKYDLDGKKRTVNVSKNYGTALNKNVQLLTDFI